MQSPPQTTAATVGVAVAGGGEVNVGLAGTVDVNVGLAGMVAVDVGLGGVVDVGVGLCGIVDVGVAVPRGEDVGVGVNVGVAVREMVEVGVAVDGIVDVGDEVPSAVDVGVGLPVNVGVAVREIVDVGVALPSIVDVDVGLAGVLPDVELGVGVRVAVGLPVTVRVVVAVAAATVAVRVGVAAALVGVVVAVGAVPATPRQTPRMEGATCAALKRASVRGMGSPIADKAAMLLLKSSRTQRSSLVHALKSPIASGQGWPMFTGVHVPALQVSQPKKVKHLSPSWHAPVCGLQKPILHGSAEGGHSIGFPGTQKVNVPNVMHWPGSKHFPAPGGRHSVPSGAAVVPVHTPLWHTGFDLHESVELVHGRPSRVGSP